MEDSITKIAIIEPVGGHGGMDYYNYGLASGLSINGVNVKLFTSEETKVRSYENVDTYLVFKKVWSTKNKVLKAIKLFSGYKRAYRLIKNEGIRIVHFHIFDFNWLNYLALLLAKKNGFSVVLTVHDVSSFKGDSGKGLKQKIVDLTSKIIVHNNYSYNMLVSQVKLTKANVAVIPHGNYLPFVTPKNQNRISSEPLNLLFFGQIKKVKGLEILLKAIQLVTQKNYKIKLTIAGKVWHDSKEKYEELINELGITDVVDTNFNYIPENKVDSYFHSADVVVLPYHRIYQSGVLLMSMSYGVPVLTSDLEPFQEVITDNLNGFTFTSGNSESLANRIEDILQLDLTPIAEESKKLMLEKFGWNVIGEKTKNLYKTIEN